MNQGSRRGRTADFQVCGIAGFQTCEPCKVRTRQSVLHAADLEIGDTAGLETCATASSCAGAAQVLELVPIKHFHQEFLKWRRGFTVAV